MKPANSLMSGLGTTVFEVMSALAREHQSVNLGQGFPDDKGPDSVRAAAADYLMNGHNQYPPMMGIPELRQAVAEHAKRFQGLDVDWQAEVLVTSGATEALGDCLFGLIEPGEVVEFSTWTPHWFGAADGPVEAIMIFGVHGQRLHLHE